ncbi:hypothetical protein C723_2882 [Christiangramia flava JLT2011]|uniref:Uncharacterized protein n=2 Tax=Christiangramia TaxID=292691 RepID=A0A1L7I4W5_9FLAO|nr:hypothetical protein GRFL_1933 [Christiangramia flava JLT2011]OSS38181.1 hypothetical protein C723_2882 [Christiangramia flava JLT2011]
MSYYLSVFFIAFLFYGIISFYIPALQKRWNLIIISTFLFLLKVFVEILNNASITDILLPLRHLVCFIGIIIISENLIKAHLPLQKVKLLIGCFLIILLGVVLAQYYYFSKGIFFGIPIDLFVMNKGTLEGASKALYYGTRFRPVGFYGEPSYNSWIVISLLMIILIRDEFTKKFKYTFIIISYLIIIISQAMSGFFAINIILLTWFIKTNRDSLIYIVVLVLISIILFVINKNFQIFERLYGIIEGSDRSYNGRLIQPLEYIKEIWKNQSLFGIPNYSDIRDDIDNAAIALVLNYGILSIPIFLAFVKLFKHNWLLILYILLSLNFNGSIFRFDKVLVLSLVIGLSYCTFSNFLGKSRASFI